MAFVSEVKKVLSMCRQWTNTILQHSSYFDFTDLLISFFSPKSSWWEIIMQNFPYPLYRFSPCNLSRRHTSKPIVLTLFSLLWSALLAVSTVKLELDSPCKQNSGKLSGKHWKLLSSWSYQYYNHFMEINKVSPVKMFPCPDPYNLKCEINKMRKIKEFL